MPGVNVLSYHPLGGPRLGISSRLPMGNSFTIPQMGFGTYRIPEAECSSAVSYALECGFRHIDCAKAYSNQRAIGEVLSTAVRTRRVKREDLFVTSKLWPTDQHPDHVENACRESLKDLQLGYLDLYLIHWPVCWQHSPRFTTEEDKYPKTSNGLAAVDKSVSLLDTWKAMEHLVDKGLVRSIGLANCNGCQVEKIFTGASSHTPVINQIELHPGHVDRELLNVHGAHQIITAAYSPLGMASRYTPPDFVPLCKDEALRVLAEHTGFSVPRMLLNWNLDMNHVVIVKSSTREHTRANAKAARFALSDPTRWALDTYRTRVRSFRVMNPTTFTDDGKPFFS